MPLNHKTGAGGHLKVSPFKAPSPLAVARRNKGVKLEAFSSPTLPKERTRPMGPMHRACPPLDHPPLCCSARPLPLSSATRPSASSLSQVNSPSNPAMCTHPLQADTHTHRHTVQVLSHPFSGAAFRAFMYNPVFPF